MTRSTALALAIALSLAAPLAAAQDAAPAPSQENPVSANPFFARSTLPYQLPPFDQIRDEHFAPPARTRRRSRTRSSRWRSPASC